MIAALTRMGPPKLLDWMKSQGLPDVQPSGAVPAATAPAAPAAVRPRVGSKPTAAAPKPEHQATAADYVKKIRDAKAKGDLEGAAQLKKEGARFLSTVPGYAPPGALPPQDENDDEDDNLEEDDDE
jgi:hypothetical protein